MDIVIEFFRDTLDGPFYIVWVVVLVILIFACIGYLAEKGIKNKNEKEKYATVDDTNNTAVIQDNVVNDTQVTSTSVTTPINEPVSDAIVSEEVPTSIVNNTDSDSGVDDTNVVAEPTITEVTSAVSLNTVDNSTTSLDDSQVKNVITQVEVSQPSNVVTPTVVNPQVEQATNNVTTPSSEVNQVVIPTINQDGNDNTI